MRAFNAPDFFAILFPRLKLTLSEASSGKLRPLLRSQPWLDQFRPIFTCSPQSIKRTALKSIYMYISPTRPLANRCHYFASPSNPNLCGWNAETSKGSLENRASDYLLYIVLQPNIIGSTSYGSGLLGIAQPTWPDLAKQRGVSEACLPTFGAVPAGCVFPN